MRQRNEIAKELARLEKTLEHLRWVGTTKLTLRHRMLLDREIEETRLAIAKLTLAFHEVAS